MIYPVLYKYATDKKRINQWQVEVKGDCYRTISGFYGMTLTTTEWTCAQPKNLGKSNVTTAAQQAEAEADALHRKRIEKGYTDDFRKLNVTTKHFEPMLAKKFEDEKNNLVWPLYIQPKLDGIRCIAKADGLWSRNGKPLLSVPHIFNALKPLFSQFPELILDGELYCDKLANDFNEIISLCRKTKPTAEDLAESEKIIEYHIYDIPGLILPGHVSFSQRFLKAKQHIKLPKYCKWVDTIKLEKDSGDVNHFQIMAHLGNYLGMGYEGQMIRLDRPYENKRSKSLLKHKLFQDDEFVITGVVEGRGNMSNKVGKVKFTTKQGKECEAAINASWSELEKYWKNKDKLIGQKITVKYFGETEDGSLRFPKVVSMVDRNTYE